MVDIDGSLFRDRYKLIVSIKKAEFRGEDFWNEMVKMDKKRCEVTGKKPNTMYFFQWYPLSRKYSYLLNYPEDIKPDWLALIEECKRMLIADGIDINQFDD